ncbi:MAG: SRPBCC family protein [Cellulomonadaceae bacterium]
MSAHPIRTALLTAVAVAGTAVVLRRRQLRWGATADEGRAVLPGDDLVPRANVTATRAVSIDAPPSAVLPWLRQLGYRRGGFYTYDALENLVGLDLHSADRVHPEWQAEQGDDVHLAENVPLRVEVLDEGVLVEGGGAVVLHGVETAGPPMPFDFSWAFVVRPSPSGGSRLLIRERYGYRTAAAVPIVELTIPISWLMTQRMLRGLRERATAPSP